VQVVGAGERFVQGRTEVGLVRCGCCTLLLHCRLTCVRWALSPVASARRWLLLLLSPLLPAGITRIPERPAYK
jgi:hypothetical protein